MKSSNGDQKRMTDGHSLIDCVAIIPVRGGSKGIAVKPVPLGLPAIEIDSLDDLRGIEALLPLVSDPI